MILQIERTPDGIGVQQPKRPARKALVLVSVLIAMVVAIVAGVGLRSYATRPAPSEGTIYRAPNTNDGLDTPVKVPNANEREGRVTVEPSQPNANTREGRVSTTTVSGQNANAREGRVGN